MNGAGMLPPEVATEAGELIDELRSVGWTIRQAQFDAKVFGNWIVDLQRGNRTLQLVKDRSQFMVGPSTEEMKDAGLWRAFGSFEEFHAAIRNFAIFSIENWD